MNKNEVINDTLDKIHAVIADHEKKQNRLSERNKELAAEIRRNEADILILDSKVREQQSAYDMLLGRAIKSAA